MDHDFNAFLKTNDAPPPLVVLKARNLLAAPLRDQEETKEEIQRLESRLKDLNAKHNAIQGSFAKCRAILSPARRLPPDVVHEIFYHCLPTYRNPTMSASEAPMLLTRICSSWRSIALSSPRLWARIHIPFSDDYRPDWAPGFEVSEQTTSIMQFMERTLRLRCTVVDQWLTRAGTCPLSISLKFHSEASSGERKSWWGMLPPPLTENLLGTLARVAPRWKDIELDTTIEVYRQLEGMVSVDTLSMLTSFKGRFSVCPHWSELTTLNSPQPQDPIRFLTARNLKKVSLGMRTVFPEDHKDSYKPRDYDTWAFPDMQQQYVWSRLTYLCFHVPLSIPAALNMLRYFPKLVHCRLSVRRKIDQSRYYPDPGQELISLPHLRSLCVDQDHTSQFPVGVIDAPQLKWIDCQMDFDYHVWYRDSMPFELLPLLQKSTELEKLTLVPRLSALEMRSVLQIISTYNITHLVLGPEPVGPLRLMPAGTDTSQGWLPRWKDLFDCNLLDPLGGGSQETVVLPNLQILEITYETDVSDQDLLRLITRRMDPFSPHGVAVLTSVRVLFGRVRDPDVDIAEEVSRFAERVGVGVNLELNYLSEAPDPYFGRLRASYGLPPDSPWDDKRRWETFGYHDIEETVP